MLLLSGSLSAQYNSNFLKYERLGHGVIASLDYEAGSNGISSSVSNRLIWGGYISEESKQHTSDLLRERNNLGINFNYDLSAFIKASPRYDLLFAVKHQEFINSTFTDDFFNLVFRGNGYFKGRSADLSNSSFNNLRFQEFKVGAIMHHVDSLGKIGVALSLLKGEQLFQLRTFDNTSLYTSSNFNEVVFNSNLTIAQSDSSNVGPFSWNGTGASADLFFTTPYRSRLGKRSLLTVNASNIGFIYWSNKSLQYTSDSSLSFKGFTINNIEDLRDSSVIRINRDTLVGTLTDARKGGFTTNIPASLVIINKIYFGEDERTTVSLGFRHIFNASYKGYIFIEPEYRVGMLTAGLHIGYGGYTRLNVGLSATVDKGSLFLRLGSNALQGFFMPKRVFSQSVFFSLGWRV